MDFDIGKSLPIDPSRQSVFKPGIDKVLSAEAGTGVDFSSFLFNAMDGVSEEDSKEFIDDLSKKIDHLISSMLSGRGHDATTEFIV